MTDEFIRRGLTTSVAQICSNIGWHSMSNSTLQMMTDILYDYFKDLAQSVKKFSEISDTLEPDIDDVRMAFQDKDVSVPDLIKYLKQVGPVEFPHQVPKFPIPTKSNLNIMKPGSREIVTRPVYVHEHLPTMYPEQSDDKTIQNDSSLNQTPHTSSSTGNFNDSLNIQESQASKTDGQLKDNMIVHRRLREISSVVMTTSGFLSPSREGKLPESRLMPFPNFKASSSQSSSHPTVPPEVRNEHNQPQRHKKLPQKTQNTFKEKGKNLVESSNSSINISSKNEDSKVKKLTSVKETSKLKALKTGAIRESNPGPKLKKLPKIKDKSKLNLLSTIFDKPLQASSSHSKHSKNMLGENEKLTTEPDKQKLNIFKKISKIKEDKNNESSGHQSLKSNSLITPKPTSTTVSSNTLIKTEPKSDVIEEKPFKPVFFKPPAEKKNDGVQKPSIKDIKKEINSDAPKKRKKKQKTPSGDPSNIDTINSNTGTKKPKNKHDSNLYSAPLKFSFFGHLSTPPGLLPTGPSLLPPALASNPLVPKFTTANNVLPVLDKASTMTSMMYLPLPGEDDFDKSEFDELSTTLTSEKEKVPAEKIKPKKEHKKIKKEKIKSKKKKDKKDKTKQKDRSERKKEKLLKKLMSKEKELDSEESPKQESAVVEVTNKEPEPAVKEDDPLVPKIKLKLPGSNGPSSSPSLQRKIVIKPVVKNKSPDCVDELHDSPKEKIQAERVKPSSTKSKTHSKEKSSTVLPSVSLKCTKEEDIESVPETKQSKSKKSTPTVPPVVPPSIDVDIDVPPTTSGNTSVSSSVDTNSAASSNKPKIKTIKKSKKTETEKHAAFYFDAAGNQVWICPTCGKQDDGSPMIGCDGCDAWYHWVCQGIQCPPDCAVWYCPTCLLKRAERGMTGAPVEKAKRGRPLKKKSIS